MFPLKKHWVVQLVQAFVLKLTCEKLFPSSAWRSALFLINLVQLVNFLPVNGAARQKWL